ncbi:hypothetical protein MC7420_5003 [Coleofasciculus chthonoplastes PCC 7420]|uniref:Uncharacterized protein n=1 Tax=Coleofasciculus chthonoplastes PCC 7420 TaxID=118168 RepID=B4VZB7_9CYAN|nr:hypothetical protein MC7420_5003 [Coleofasciculus chthonoplastes PCC 7420]
MLPILKRDDRPKLLLYTLTLGRKYYHLVKFTKGRFILFYCQIGMC